MENKKQMPIEYNDDMKRDEELENFMNCLTDFLSNRMDIRFDIKKDPTLRQAEWDSNDAKFKEHLKAYAELING